MQSEVNAMQKELKLSYEDVIDYVGIICEELEDDEVHVDMVVCLSPSSTSLGQMMSNYLDVPLQCVSWDLNNDNNESNCWLPEDASEGKQLLIITETDDDALISSLIEDWTASVCGDTEWLDNVIFCSLVAHEFSNFEVDYSGLEVTDQVVSMPWSDWWK